MGTVRALGLLSTLLLITIPAVVWGASWSFSPPSGIDPSGRYGYASAIVDGDIIVYGGSGGNLRSFAEVNDLYRYRVTENIWERVVVAGPPPTGLGRYGAVMVNFNGGLIMFGGSSSIDYLNDLWRFDLTLRRWKQITPVNEPPSPRQQMGYVVKGSSLYIFGGISAYAWERDMWELNLLTYTWTQIAVTNILPDLSGPAYLGGKGHTSDYRSTADSIVVFGGSPGVSTEAVNVDYACEYDIGTRTWRRLVTTAATDADRPVARNVASSMIYTDKLYLFGGFSDLIAEDLTGMYELDLTALAWRFIPATGDEPSARDSMSLIPLPPPSVLPPGYRPTVLLFGGWGALVFNELYTFQLVPDAGTIVSVAWTQVRRQSINPASRSFQTSALRGTQLIVFAGQDSSQQLLNDLWSLDQLTGRWTNVLAIGASPAPRKLHSSCIVGDVLFVFGGAGATGLFGDLWQFSFIASEWKQIDFAAGTGTAAASVLQPDARQGHAMTSSDLTLYVVGGKGGTQFYSDVWQFETVTRRWSVLFPSTVSPAVPVPRFQFGFGVFTFANAQYVANMTVNLTLPSNFTNTPTTIAFGIFGGLDVGFTEQNDFWLFFVANRSWSQPTTLDVQPRSSNAAAASGTKLINSYGQYYEDSINDLLVITPNDTSPNGGFYTADPIPIDFNITSPNQVPRPLVSHSMVAIRDSMLVFGGFSSLGSSVSVVPTSVPGNTENRVFRLTLTPLCQIVNGAQVESNTCFLCAPGSIAQPKAGDPTSVECVSCNEGKYTSQFGATACELCLPGFSSSLIGSQTSVSCQACGEGKFNNQSGATACMTCPVGSICPAATINPSYGSAVSPLTSVQPQPLGSRTIERLNAQSSVLFGAAGNIALVVAIILILVKIRRQDMLLSLDIFTNIHRPMSQEQRVLKEWQSTLGGMVSLVAIVVVVYFIALQSLAFIDNIREVRSLIPNLAAPRDLITSAIFTAQLSFRNYGANCVLGGAAGATSTLVGACVPEVTVATDGLYVSRPSLTCSYELSVCNVSYTCPACNMTAATGRILISLNQPFSYATAIFWNYTTSSGIPPNQISSIASSLASEKGQSFRGPDPTVIALQKTRTIFTDNTGAQPPDGSGYQIEFVSNTTGSQVNAALFPYTRQLLFEFSIERSQNTFTVVRDQLLTEATFVAALLGGVSGVIGGLGALLGVIEAVQLYFVKKRAVKYAESVRRTLPFDLPFRSARENHVDWPIAVVFSKASARMLKAEADSGYTGARTPPQQPRALQAKELFIMLLFEVVSWCLPLRILSSTTADQQLQQSSFGVTIAVDLVRALFWLAMSVRLAGGVGTAIGLSVKYDILQGRALLFTISYFGLILPSSGGASPVAVISSLIFNVTLCGYTRIVHRYVVWDAVLLKVYQYQRLIAPVLWTAVGAAYAVQHSDDTANANRNLNLIYFLIGLAFYYELTAKVFRMEGGRPESARVKLAPTAHELRQLTKRYGSNAVEAGLNVVTSTGRTTTTTKSEDGNGAPTLDRLGSTSALVVVSVPVPSSSSPAASSSSSSSSSGPVSAPASPPAAPLPQPEERPKLYPTLISGAEFWIAVFIEILSSTSPVAKVVDDHSRGDTGSTYQQSLIATTVLVWIRTLWWLYLGSRVLGLRHFFARSVFALDSITARTFAVEITYTAYLCSIRTDGTTAIAVISDWIFGFVFAGYMRTMFGFYKFNEDSVLAFYKLQRLYAPILYLVTGLVILAFPVYQQTPAPYLIYLVTSIEFYFDIYREYAGVKRWSDADTAPGNVVVRGHFVPAVKTRVTTITKASDGGDIAKEEPPTISSVLVLATILVEVLSSTGPIFRLLASSANEGSNSETAQTNALIANTVTGWARIAFWLFVDNKLRASQNTPFASAYLLIDDLGGRICLSIICYAALVIKASPIGAWVGLSIATEFLLILTLAGHVRLMITHFNWSYESLWAYKLQRLYAPVLNLCVSVIVIYRNNYSPYNTSDAIANNITTDPKVFFVLYLLYALAFEFDLFWKVGEVPTVARVKPVLRKTAGMDDAEDNARDIELAAWKQRKAAKASGGVAAASPPAAASQPFGSGDANGGADMKLNSSSPIAIGAGRATAPPLTIDPSASPLHQPLATPPAAAAGGAFTPLATSNSTPPNGVGSAPGSPLSPSTNTTNARSRKPQRSRDADPSAAARSH